MSVNKAQSGSISAGDRPLPPGLHAKFPHFVQPSSFFTKYQTFQVNFKAIRCEGFHSSQTLSFNLKTLTASLHFFVIESEFSSDSSRLKGPLMMWFNELVKRPKFALHSSKCHEQVVTLLPIIESPSFLQIQLKFYRIECARPAKNVKESDGILHAHDVSEKLNGN